MIFLLHWLVATLALIIAAYILPGVVVDGFMAALVASLIIGFVNAVVRPILIILTLPITILTLGLFTLVINAALILLTSAVVPGFHVKNFWWAMLFSVVLTFVMFLLRRITK